MESLMQYVWQFRLWPMGNMVTSDGRRVRVIDPGLLNHDSGPDFFNAKVIIGGEQWIGNIEIHVRASDWFRHNHDSDVSYDSVVLHVVDVDDAQVYRSNGERIPQMVMHCDPDFSKKYHEMVHNPLRELACGKEITTLPHIYLTDWFTSLAFERLYAKADRVHQLLKLYGQSWQESIYITLARALGFNTNSEPFQLLAQSTPLKYMLHHTDSPEMIEAVLFGQAGFLECADSSNDPYLARLIMDYQFLKAKYQLTPSSNLAWKMARMRPQNFPHRRIAALAQMISQNTLFSNKILELRTADDARALFDITLNSYWATHFNFSPAPQTSSPKAFGISSVNVLLINVVVPVVFAYAQTTGDERRQEFAVELLQSLRPESNRIIDIFRHAGIEVPDAFTTQALIQLKRDYCEQRKCLYCRIGHRLLSKKVPR